VANTIIVGVFFATDDTEKNGFSQILNYMFSIRENPSHLLNPWQKKMPKRIVYKKNTEKINSIPIRENLFFSVRIRGKKKCPRE
jgi:hypothetical protein